MVSDVDDIELKINVIVDKRAFLKCTKLNNYKDLCFICEPAKVIRPNGNHKQNLKSWHDNTSRENNYLIKAYTRI